LTSHTRLRRSLGKEFGQVTGDGGAKPKTPVLRRFHGSAKIDATRLSRDVDLIARSVVQHLAGLLDAKVTITVEIEAEISCRVRRTTWSEL
jgi:hypothetical protein